MTRSCSHEVNANRNLFDHHSPGYGPPNRHRTSNCPMASPSCVLAAATASVSASARAASSCSHARSALAAPVESKDPAWADSIALRCLGSNGQSHLPDLADRGVTTFLSTQSAQIVLTLRSLQLLAVSHTTTVSMDGHGSTAPSARPLEDSRIRAQMGKESMALPASRYSPAGRAPRRCVGAVTDVVSDPGRSSASLTISSPKPEGQCTRLAQRAPSGRPTSSQDRYPKCFFTTSSKNCFVKSSTRLLLGRPLRGLMTKRSLAIS